MKRARKILVPLAAVALTLLALRVAGRAAVEWIASPAVDHRRPALYLPETTMDLGYLTEELPPSVAFVVENRGNKRLTIREIGAGCCGQGQSHPAVEVAPGATAQLVVPLGAATLARGGEQRVRYQSNDPARPAFSLAVRAAIEPQLAGGMGAAPASSSYERSVLVDGP
jgi:hypothetical protein